MLFAAFRAMLAEATSIPRAVSSTILWSDMEELAVVFRAVSLHEKVAERHARHVILMQIFASVHGSLMSF